MAKLQGNTTKLPEKHPAKKICKMCKIFYNNIFMQFIDHISKNQAYFNFYQNINKFCQLEVKANDIEKLGYVPREIWQKMGSANLLGITVAKEFLGQELSIPYHLIAMTVISSHLPALGLSYGAHSNLCVHQLHKYGTDTQKLRYLPKLVTGEFVGALAMTEVNAGSDVLNMQMSAVDDGQGNYILNGRKMWITNGPCADVIIVYARTQANAITAFIVDKTCPNWFPAQSINKLGMKGSETSELVFNNCPIPKTNVLGEINKAKYILMDGLNTERLVLSGGPLGIMEKCLKLMHKYMNDRQQFNKSIGSFQLMQAKIAECYAAFASTSAWAMQIAEAEDINRHDPTALLMLASSHASKIASETIQTFGGNGYSEDYEAARLYRDAKLYEIGAGTNEIRKSLVGRYLLDEKYD